MHQKWSRGMFALCALGCLGCTSAKTTNTARSATEQLLVSNSVDQALAKVNFRPFRERSIFLEEKYLDSVDKNYILASVRHHVIQAGARLAVKPEQADVILEVRSGGVGTESKDMFIGFPALSIPVPVPISLPEVRLVSKTSQSGTAKIGLVAYDAKSRASFGNGGVALSQSNNNNWYFFGVGPYQDGSLGEELTRQSSRPRQGQPLPDVVAFRESDPPQRIHLTADRKESKEQPPKFPTGK